MTCMLFIIFISITSLVEAHFGQVAVNERYLGFYENIRNGQDVSDYLTNDFVQYTIDAINGVNDRDGILLDFLTIPGRRVSIIRTHIGFDWKQFKKIAIIEANYELRSLFGNRCGTEISMWVKEYWTWRISSLNTNVIPVASLADPTCRA